MCKLELDFHRCPSAMTMTRIFISDSINKGEIEINISSIEPMLESHIRAFINTIESNKVAIVCVSEEPIKDIELERWKQHPMFDEDDLDNVFNKKNIKLSISPVQV